MEKLKSLAGPAIGLAVAAVALLLGVQVSPETLGDLLGVDPACVQAPAE